MWSQGLDEPVPKLLRAAGIALAGSGLLTLVYFAGHPTQGEPPPPDAVTALYAPLHAVGIAGQLSFIVGVSSLYLIQARKFRRTGLAGYVLLVLGSIFIIGTLWGDGFFTPVLATKAPQLFADRHALYSGPLFIASAVAVATYIPGFLLFGIATYRARVMRRWAVVAMTVGGLCLLVPPEPVSSVPWWFFIAGAALMAVGLVRIGLDVWRDPRIRDTAENG